MVEEAQHGAFVRLFGCSVVSLVATMVVARVVEPCVVLRICKVKRAPCLCVQGRTRVKMTFDETDVISITIYV